MNQKLKWYLSVAVNIVLVLMISKGVWNYYQMSQNAESIRSEVISPDFDQVKDLSGQPFSFESLTGKPNVLFFWATWCAPCRLELARVRSAIAEGEIKPESVYAISIGEDSQTVLQAATDRSYNFPILLDQDAALAQSLNIRATPTVLYMDKDLKVTNADAGISPFLIAKMKDHLLPN